MRSFIRFAKTWAVINLVTRLVFVVGFVVLVMAVVMGGGEIKITWGQA